jgi:GH25 family lysozyme M1 (1,4-beta-N-acetylmuramidase)
MQRTRSSARLAVSLSLCLVAAGATSFTSAGAASAAGEAVADNGPHAPSDPAAQVSTGMMPASSPDAVVARRSEEGRAAAVRSAVTSAAVSGDALGVDVASYQHPSGRAITWSAVHASGQTFAVVKATEGTSYVNSYVTADAAGARAAGLQIGLYHFADPALTGGSPTPDAVAEADHFAAQVKAVGGSQLPPTLDLEETGGLTPAQLASWTGSFLSRVQSDTGRRPMIYTGPYFWNDDVQSSGFGSYPLWEAEYTSASTPIAVRGWSTWSLWQYSDGAYGAPAAVPGISAVVDRDRYRGAATAVPSFAEAATGNSGNFSGTASAAAYPNGLLVQEVGEPYVYEMAGLAPVYLPSFSETTQRVVHVLSVGQFHTLRLAPLDGTWLRGAETGQVYRVAGGAPVYISSFAPFHGPPSTLVTIGQPDLDRAGTSSVYLHLLGRPTDGTFLTAVESGAVFRMAGGAPVYVSSWSYFGGGQATVGVTQASINNAGAASGPFSHLSYIPADGTDIADAYAGTYWVMSAGHLIPTPNSGQPFVVEGDSAITHRGEVGYWSHLL